MTAIIVLGSIFSYLTTAGYLYPRFYEFNYNGKPNMSRSDASFMAGLYSIFFPLALPLGLGNALGTRHAGKTGTRIERKRNREIADAKHQQELARLNAETLRLKELEAGIR